jgi:hypothetical protein
MALHVIDTHAQHCSILGGEKAQRLAEPGHLGRTNEGEVTRVKEQHHQLGTDSRQRDAAAAAIDEGRQIKGRDRVSGLEHVRS